MQDHEMKAMLIEYMGKGFLDNIVALFKQEPPLSRFISDMLADEDLKVRLGTIALVEELAAAKLDGLQAAVPGLIGLLRHASPTVRGDAASVLGTIQDPAARPVLEACLHDDHAGVREIAREALREMDREH